MEKAAQSPVTRVRRRWIDAASAAAVLLFAAWTVSYVVALLAIPTGCATEMGFESGYEAVEGLLNAWVWLVLLVGVGYLVTAVWAFLARRLDPPSRGLLLGVGLLLLAGPLIVYPTAQHLVLDGTLERTYTVCDV